METRPASAGLYPKVHGLLYFVSFLSIMLALDVVYGSLLLHGNIQKRLAARRLAQAERRQISKPATSASASPAANMKQAA